METIQQTDVFLMYVQKAIFLTENKNSPIFPKKSFFFRKHWNNPPIADEVKFSLHSMKKNNI